MDSCEVLFLASELMGELGADMSTVNGNRTRDFWLFCSGIHRLSISIFVKTDVYLDNLDEVNRDRIHFPESVGLDCVLT